MDDPAMPVDRPALEKLGRETVHHAFGLIDRRVTLEALRKDGGAAKTAAGELLSELLRDKQRNALGRLFLVLGLLYPGERFERIQRGLGSADSKARASSRELLDGVITGPMKTTIALLVDDLEDDEKLRRAASFYERTKALDYVGLLTLLAVEARDVASLARHHALELGVELAGGGDGGGTLDPFLRRSRAGSSPPEAEVSHA